MHLHCKCPCTLPPKRTMRWDTILTRQHSNYFIQMTQVKMSPQLTSRLQFCRNNKRGNLSFIIATRSCKKAKGKRRRRSPGQTVAHQASHRWQSSFSSSSSSKPFRTAYQTLQWHRWSNSWSRHCQRRILSRRCTRAARSTRKLPMKWPKSCWKPIISHQFFFSTVQSRNS